MAQPKSISGAYVSQVDATEGKITVAFKGARANDAIRSSTLVLSPITHSPAASTGACTASTLDGKYLPSICRK